MSDLIKPMQSNQKRRSTRRGASLIDVATGSMLLAILLIPSVQLIGESQSANRRLTDRDTMLFEAEQLIESTKVALSETAPFDAAYATPIDVVSSIAVTDGPDLTSRLRVAADASLPAAKLLTIMVDLWHDSDGDRQLDATERSVSQRTQWATP